MKQSPPNPEIPIKITVPQEYCGVAIGQLNQCDGVVTAMELQEPHMLINASLPESRLDDLSAGIIDFTMGRGRVERDDS